MSLRSRAGEGKREANDPKAKGEKVTDQQSWPTSNISVHLQGPRKTEQRHCEMACDGIINNSATLIVHIVYSSGGELNSSTLTYYHYYYYYDSHGIRGDGDGDGDLVQGSGRLNH